MRCHTRATDCPVAARHGNAALWPSPWPRLCTYKKLFQSTVSNYLSRNPHIFCRLFLIRSQYSRNIGLSFAIDWDSAASRLLLSIIKIRGLTMRIGGGSFQSSYISFWSRIFYLARQSFRTTIFAIRVIRFYTFILVSLLLPFRLVLDAITYDVQSLYGDYARKNFFIRIKIYTREQFSCFLPALSYGSLIKLRLST